MLKRIPMLLAGLSVILAACGGAPQTQDIPATGTAPPTRAPQPVSPTSPAPTQTTATIPTGSSVEQVAVPARCTVVSPQPTPGPTEQSLFPPPGEEDWILGPESAAVTFTEYSDFQ